MTAAPTPSAAFKTRPLRKGDLPFLFSSFLLAMRDEKTTEGVANGALYATWSRVFEDALSTCNVLVAHPAEDDDEIAGYVVWKDRVLVFIYVKRDPWRRMGVGRLLMEASRLIHAETIAAMFPTSLGMRVAKQKGLDVRRCTFMGGLAVIARGK